MEAPKVDVAMTRAIVEAVDPERIILFGSAARGQMRAGSDLDVLVVKIVSTRLEERTRHMQFPRELDIIR